MTSSDGANSNTYAARFSGLKHMIGNTPLLAIRFSFRGRPRTIYAKAENLNLTGSIKDRMAFHILRNAYKQGKIEPGFTIAEATSGNTGISFAAIGRALGHDVVVYMPEWMSKERLSLIQSLGARVVTVSEQQGGFLGSISKTQELAATSEHVFLPCQFSNDANADAHEQSTGPELWWQLYLNSITPDAFVAGVGTGGTIMGVGRYLRRQQPDIHLYPVEPRESPTLSTGFKSGRHRIQGISDEFIPPIVGLDELNEVIAVSDGDAILMAQKLAAQLGLAVGISSGANFLGALMAQEMLGEEAVVATVFPDDNKKYLSTDLMREEPEAGDYLSPDVKLDQYHALRRVCYTCFDMEDAMQMQAVPVTTGC